MKCHVCGKHVNPKGVSSLYRVSYPGPDSVWSCWEHLTDEEKDRLDPETIRLVKIIEGQDGKSIKEM